MSDQGDQVSDQGDGTGVPTNEETAVEEPGAGDDVEMDEFDGRIADLGPVPGPGASAAESDRYNFAMAEIEADRRKAYEDSLESGEVVPTEDTSGERPDVILLDPVGTTGTTGTTNDDAAVEEPIP
jgi:hypothetical protein